MPTHSVKLILFSGHIKIMNVLNGPVIKLPINKLLKCLRIVGSVFHKYVFKLYNNKNGFTLM